MYFFSFLLGKNFNLAANFLKRHSNLRCISKHFYGGMYHTHFQLISPLLNEPEIEISMAYTEPNFPQKKQVICGMCVDFSPTHLFLCPVSTWSECCWEQAAIKWFPWEATESGREKDWRAVYAAQWGSISMVHLVSMTLGHLFMGPTRLSSCQ